MESNTDNLTNFISMEDSDTGSTTLINKNNIFSIELTNTEDEKHANIKICSNGGVCFMSENVNKELLFNQLNL